MNITPVRLSLQRVCRGAGPARSDLLRWVRETLSGRKTRAALTIRIVDVTESAALNAAWRHKSGPTNVLSFPITGLDQFAPELLGDIVICAPLVISEACEQGKLPLAHWAHLVVHGTLHLLGYDHIEEKDALDMECLECEILARLGFPNPYQEQ